MSEAKKPLLEVKDLKTWFPIRSGIFSKVTGQVKAVDGVSFSLGRKETLGLVGESGCGKTTLLNCIAGLLDIDDGQIWIESDNVTWKEPKDRHIGMVFQSYALYPSMTVEKNLSFSHGIF